jgi:site-specific DNA recombinase
MLVAAYARYSSSNQREESIDAQLRAIKDYAQKNKLNIVAKYIDMAKSATTSDRPQFIKMLKDARKKIFDMVLVHKLDRFARNRYDAAITRRELKKLNVKIVSVTERIDGSPESILLESLLDGLNEYYSVNLARETMKGLLENAHRGIFNGGRVPIGLDISDKKYVINEVEAQAIKIIFDMVLQGYTYGQIINNLHDLGYRTKAGREFKKNSLHTILTNEKYAGIYTFNKTPRRKADGTRNNRTTKDESDIIRLPGAIPAIIPYEQFQKVQELLKTRKLQNRNDVVKPIEPYILSGLVSCGHCGGKLNGETRKNGYKSYRYYTCGNLRSGCSQKSIPKAEFEKAVTDEIAQHLFKPELAEIYAEKINKIIQEKQSSFDVQSQALQGKIKEINKGVDKLLDAIQAGCAPSVVKPRLNNLSEQKENLQKQLNKLKVQAQQELANPDTIKKFLENNLGILESADLEQCKKLCKQYIEKITVKDYDIRVEALFSILEKDNVYHGGVGDGTRTHTV